MMPRVPIDRRFLFRYGMAIAAVVAVFLGFWGMVPYLGPRGGLVLFFPALIVVAFYGGLGPGLLATALSGLSVGLFLGVSPRHAEDSPWIDALLLGLFLLSGGMLSYLGQALCNSRLREAQGLSRSREAQTQAEEELRQAKRTVDFARRQAEAARRIKDEFLATLSHELRTPLNAMLGWARLLGGGDLDKGTTEQAIAAIERGARAQAQLIEDLLDVSRIISGKLRLNMREVNLASVVDAAIQSVQPAAQAKGILLERQTDQPVYPVWGDAARLQQMVWNLLSNAIKFTGQGGRVQIALQRTGSQVILVVKDNGRGIAPDFLPHVFDRFSQADGSTTRLQGGLGLGLAIVRHLVESHGGTVEAFSEGQGKGATFTVHLPMAALRMETPSMPMSVAETSTPFECPVWLEGLRVLVVDNEPDACKLISAVLQRCRALTQATTSAAEAMHVVSQFRPDVIVSDIGMHTEDGNTMIAQIRALPEALGGRTPAIALTALTRVEDRIRALSSGFQMYIPRPVDPKELVLAVASVGGRAPAEAKR